MNNKDMPAYPAIHLVNGKFGTYPAIGERRLAKFPEERPIAGKTCHLWDQHFQYIGIGSSFHDRSTGIAFLCNGRKFDSNRTVFWAALAELEKRL